MQLKVYNDYDGLSAAAADILLMTIQQNPQAVICLASGDTPKQMCKLFTEKVQEQKTDISGVTFIGLDEWVGIPPDNTGSCSYFFQEFLFKPLQLPAAQYHLFDALGNLEAECNKMDEIIARHDGIDLMIVGVGLNGHIGFNEPGVSPDNKAHVIKLDTSTQETGQKYFSSAVTIDKGITLGLQYLLETKHVIMLANGEKKAAIVRKAVHEPISTAVPATIMRMHANGELIIDTAAASLLDDNDLASS